MKIRGYKLARRHAPVLAQVEASAEQAATLVREQMRERLGTLEIVVTDRAGMEDTVQRAHEDLLGGRSLERHYRYADAVCGCTTIGPNGVLIVINAKACGTDRRETAITLVHELVHGVQYSRAKATGDAVRALHNNYRITALSNRDAQRMNRQVDADEREAKRLEWLARKIR
ncbi:hypothetical protein OTB20_01110 [Streptomyces sp. H27-H1]|uniref:hypothetical protein n=1 Tax=Streptomyces sp. H27-H1 TaxID=2996461 RepID=UPI00226EB2E8|nr:hypothetical protein [Streptomyces sp. H27-H1]MCY0924837.1 hypothetical protein [Streptomyces sp. H27-H1]